MGLSSKEVSSRDGGGGGAGSLCWTKSFLESGGLEFPKNHPQLIQQQQQQQQQQKQQRSQMTPLKCPRCDSMNTKFCYYNNYNRSQPRHFCKACKRHWTKGGMLRNVPVGGGRKNKRLKTTNTNSTNSSKRVSVTNHDQQQQKQQQQQQHIINDCHELGHGTFLEPLTETSQKGIQMNQHQKNISEFLNQAFISPTTLDFVNNQNSFLVPSDDDLSSSSVPIFNFTGLTSTFENHPSSMSSSSSFAGGFDQSSNVFNFLGEETGDEDLTNPTTITTTSIFLPPPSTPTPIPWQLPNYTSSIVDSTTMTPPINWSWEDLNTLISTDLNHPWDENGNQNK